MKEMVGGCCVCSDESGSPENPLVYCDGDGCTVAVHQACYGIISVPAGSWYCKRCESQERAAKVVSPSCHPNVTLRLTIVFVQRCCLCPSRDGALKRTNNGQWAHVVCALYIPEVRFGDVATMEPIVLSCVPPDRWKQSCYMCESVGKEEKSRLGACMPCNKTSCKNFFHVTCAQAKGLLCEEQGQKDETVRYSGYCNHHYQKILNSSEKVTSKDSRRFTLIAKRKDGPVINIKPIPAFRPVPSARAVGSPDSSPEKKSPASYSSSGYSSLSGKDHAKDSTDSISRSKDRDRGQSSTNASDDKDTGGKKYKKDPSRTSVAAGGASTSSHGSNSHSATSSAKKESSFSSSSSKDKEKDSLFAKEREKERQEKERERAKELISSRPFDERPAGGQFSLSSFINPNLANKNQSKKLQPEPASASSSSSSSACKSSDSNHKEKSGINKEKDSSSKSTTGDKISSKSSSSLTSSSKKDSDSLSSKSSSKSTDKNSTESKKAAKKASTSTISTSSSTAKAGGTGKGDKASKSGDSAAGRSKAKDSSLTGSSSSNNNHHSKAAKEGYSRRISDTSTESTDDEPVTKKGKLSSALSSSSSSLADKSSPEIDFPTSSKSKGSKKKT